jgi:hypothetical protein
MYVWIRTRTCVFDRKKGAAYTFSRVHTRSYARVHNTRMHMYTPTHVHTHNIFIHTCMHTQSYTNTHIHTHTHTYIHTYTHTYTHIRTCIHSQAARSSRRAGLHLKRLPPQLFLSPPEHRQRHPPFQHAQNARRRWWLAGRTARGEPVCEQQQQCAPAAGREEAV